MNNDKDKETIVLKEGDSLAPAIEAIKSGGIIAYPTETFYGLGVDPTDKEAVTKLFRLKGRSFKDPVSLVVSDLDMLLVVVEHVPPEAERLINEFWPGPLTIVLKARETLPLTLTAGTGRVGVRVPGLKFTREIIRAVGGPITATSANPTGEKSPVTAGEVLNYFEGLVDVIIDGDGEGGLSGALGSTVIDLTGDEIRLIRAGEIPFSQIMGNGN